MMDELTSIFIQMDWMGRIIALSSMTIILFCVIYMPIDFVRTVVRVHRYHAKLKIHDAHVAAARASLPERRPLTEEESRQAIQEMIDHGYHHHGNGIFSKAVDTSHLRRPGSN